MDFKLNASKWIKNKIIIFNKRPVSAEKELHRKNKLLVIGYLRSKYIYAYMHLEIHVGRHLCSVLIT